MSRSCAERFLGGAALSLVLSCAAAPMRHASVTSDAAKGPAVASATAAPPLPDETASPESDDHQTPKSSRQFTVLVAMLVGDKDQALEQTIIDGLHAASNELRIVTIDATLPGNASKVSRTNVSEPAQRVMTEQSADLVIWGEVTKNHPRLFVARNNAQSDPTSPLLSGSSGVAQFELPEARQNNLGDLLQLVVLTEAAEFDEQRYPIDALQPLIERLRGLLDGPLYVEKQRRSLRDATWSAKCRWSVLLTYADALQRLGRLRSDEALLEESIQRYQRALFDAPRKGSAQRWSTENQLGNAVGLLGEREVGTKRLEEAVGVHRAALKASDRERSPLDWASSQNNLGIALNAIGEREAGTRRLEESVGAFREALKVFTREQAPLQWGTIQQNLGNALFALGKRETSTLRLEEGVDAFRQALSQRTRDRQPFGWAATQNSLGCALAELGERETGTQRLEAAAVAYREAEKEYTRHRVPAKWVTAQHHLGKVLTSLGKRERGSTRLKQAVAIYRDALKTCARERAPLDWAALQNGLGVALEALSERENDPKQLQASVLAFRDALKEQTRERAPLQWAMTRNNLGTALRLLAQREGQPPCDALENHYEALLMLEPLAPPYAMDAERGLAADLGAEIPPTPTSCPNLEMLWPQVQARMGIAVVPEQMEAQR